MQVLETVTSLKLTFLSWYTDDNNTTTSNTVETLKQNNDYYDVYIASSKQNSKQNTFNDMIRFDYNVLHYPVNDHINISCLAMKIFVGMCDLNKINIDERILFNYIMRICDQYRANSYHNFHHAFCVLQFTASLITNCGIKLSQIELFSILVSALIHDVDHPGTNNDFQVKTSSVFAQSYKESVLENHHITVGLSAINSTDVNILEKWNNNDVELFQKIVRNSILATDMKLHGDMVNDLSSRCTNTYPFDLSNDEDRLFLAKHLIHASDISNSVRPIHINSIISTYIAEEFNQQTVQEKDLGVAVTSWMMLPDDVSKAKAEHNFLVHVGKPYYTLLAKCFPGYLNTLLDSLSLNIQHYQHIINATA